MMTDTDHENRFPLIFGAVAAALLLAIGSYLFWRNAPATQMGDDPAATALVAADQATSAAGMNDDDRKATEAVVRAYILKHPEIITEAVDILQRRETAMRLSAVGEKLRTPFPGAEFGNPDGDVTLVKFTDYNCGPCRASVADLRRLVEKDGNIRVVIREVPILSHTSRDAALWALAAAKQGKHRAFYFAMFGGDRPNGQSIKAAAGKAGMDMAAAEKFLATPQALTELESNVSMMHDIGASGTPTFVIGDQILEGAVGFDALQAAVDKARRQG
jgi:protein-disulfide isomerase